MFSTAIGGSKKALGLSDAAETLLLGKAECQLTTCSDRFKEV
ncbi:hypothetical protein [Methylacidiphilum kamchatkense]|nr:hypothetical protein [Methylacidiphilum kamchatkense]